MNLENILYLALEVEKLHNMSPVARQYWLRLAEMDIECQKVYLRGGLAQAVDLISLQHDKRFSEIDLSSLFISGEIFNP